MGALSGSSWTYREFGRGQLVPVCILYLSDADKRCYGNVRLNNEVDKPRSAAVLLLRPVFGASLVVARIREMSRPSARFVRVGLVSAVNPNVGIATVDAAQNRISSSYID